MKLFKELLTNLKEFIVETGEEFTIDIPKSLFMTMFGVVLLITIGLMFWILASFMLCFGLKSVGLMLGLLVLTVSGYFFGKYLLDNLL